MSFSLGQYPSEGIYLAGLAAACLIRLPFAAMYTNREEKHPLRQGLDSVILLFVLFGMFGGPALYFFSDIMSFADYRLPLIAQIFGSFVFIPGLWMLWRSHFDLGANWSPTIEKRRGHTLITEGIYSNIRHPMYTAHFLWGLAQCLLIENWIVGPSLLVSFGALYLNRVDKEEQLMLQVFGSEYQAYQRRTGRLLPKKTQEEELP